MTANNQDGASGEALAAAQEICETFAPPSLDSELFLDRDGEWLGEIIDRRFAPLRARLAEVEKERVRAFEEATRANTLYNAECRDKAAVMNLLHTHQDLQRAAESRLAAAESLNAKLAEALETAKNGIVWYQGEHPEDASEVDHEAMAEIDAALALYREGGGRK